MGKQGEYQVTMMTKDQIAKLFQKTDPVELNLLAQAALESVTNPQAQKGLQAMEPRDVIAVSNIAIGWATFLQTRAIYLQLLQNSSQFTDTEKN